MIPLAIFRAALHARHRHARDHRRERAGVPVRIRLAALRSNRFIELNGIVPAHLHYLPCSPRCSSMAADAHHRQHVVPMGVRPQPRRCCWATTKFLVFYLACGVAAAFAHILLNPFSPVPTIGASGAIAGVMGGYLIKFPRAQICHAGVHLHLHHHGGHSGGFVLLLYWFAMQFFNGVGSIGYSHASSGDVAWFAHVGGFVAGMALIWLLRRGSASVPPGTGMFGEVNTGWLAIAKPLISWPSPRTPTMSSRPAAAR